MRTAWRTLAKVSDGAAPTCSDGLSGRLSSGKARLDRGVAALQRVVVGVADPRRVGLVVGEVRGGERLGERGELLHRLLRRKLLDGWARCHGADC